MEKNKLLLQEDDCAPDARESFIKNMKKLIGLDINAFKKKSKWFAPDEMTLAWKYKGYVLSISADDPFYKLEEL